MCYLARRLVSEGEGVEVGQVSYLVSVRRPDDGQPQLRPSCVLEEARHLLARRRLDGEAARARAQPAGAGADLASGHALRQPLHPGKVGLEEQWQGVFLCAKLKNPDTQI